MPFLHFKSVKSDWIALILSFCLLQSKKTIVCTSKLIVFGQKFVIPTTVFKFFFSRGGIIIKFSVWIFVIKCFFCRWETIFKGIGRFQPSKENQAFGSCFWKLYVLKLDPYYLTQVAWVNLGTIHLRRQHVLGGEGCPHGPMVADARG